jgi:hypothetical protein
MVELYSKLSRATDFFNSVRDEEEHIEYYEVLDMIKNKEDEKEIMETIIYLYGLSH